jgi:hypothetical protein
VTSGPQGQSERGSWGAFPCVQFDRPEKTPGSELIQPGPIKHLSSNTQAVTDGAPPSVGERIAAALDDLAAEFERARGENSPPRVPIEGRDGRSTSHAK